MTPCQLHLDCINCQEQVCVKGDKVKMEWARKRLAEAQLLLAKASEAIKDGIYGAERWFDHHKETVEHLRQLCQLYDDPEIAEGAFIQLRIPKMASRLQQAADDRTGRKKIAAPKIVASSERVALSGNLTTDMRGSL